MKLATSNGRDLSVILIDKGFDPRTVHPVASCYTDWTNSAALLVYLVQFSETTANISPNSI